MTLENFKEKLKEDSLGADLIEKWEERDKVAEEFDKHVLPYVRWLIGIGLGEIVYLQTWNNQGGLGFFTLFILILSVFAGLVHQFVWVVILENKKELFELLFKRTLEDYDMSLKKKVDQEEEEQYINIMNKLSQKIKGNYKIYWTYVLYCMVGLGKLIV